MRRYTIDHEGMQRMSVLGVIDPKTSTRVYWQPDEALQILYTHLDKPGFDRERYCSRCHEYDRELGIEPHQLRLPPKPKRHVVNWDRHGYPLPWQAQNSSPTPTARQKSRPGKPMRLDACHMCLFSFLDEVERQPISDEERRGWQAAARGARDEYHRLRRAQANPDNSAELAAYVERLLAAAKKRLGQAVRDCRERGFEPWRWGARVCR